MSSVLELKPLICRKMQISPVFKTGDVLKDVEVICNFLRQYKKGDPLI
jgi:hypothetical protein